MITPGTIVPKFATEGSVGFDLQFKSLKEVWNGTKQVELLRFEQNLEQESLIRLGGFEKAKIGTGIYIEIPKGFEAQVRGKSGISLKTPINVIHGTIDSDYRGEICVIIQNSSKYSTDIYLDSFIAQLIISPIVQPTWNIVDKMTSTERGDGGFGSTGKNVINELRTEEETKLEDLEVLKENISEINIPKITLPVIPEPTTLNKEITDDITSKIDKIIDEQDVTEDTKILNVIEKLDNVLREERIKKEEETLKKKEQ